MTPWWERLYSILSHYSNPSVLHGNGGYYRAGKYQAPEYEINQ